MTKSIGGRLDLATLAALSRPETMHRPHDAATLAREARELVALGLTPRDVAQALGLAEAEVQGLLRLPVVSRG
ncbi:MAG: hypothetical protein DYH20_05555 [Gammaproteobacteria bacterium PRO9]|nr:hypothetical protein [Gammaproteobacteria bacterium PRO9]